jgi:hypothetical protein
MAAKPFPRLLLWRFITQGVRNRLRSLTRVRFPSEKSKSQTNPCVDRGNVLAYCGRVKQVSRGQADDGKYEHGVATHFQLFYY